MILRSAIRDCATGGRDAAEALVALLARIEAEGSDERGLEALSLLAGTPRAVVRLDKCGRRILWHSNHNPPAISALARDIGAGQAGPLTVALASIHHDGRVRERAVGAMLTMAHPELVPFLMLRTGDWARPVRDPARAGLVLLWHEAPAKYLRACAELTLLLEDRLRGGFAATQLMAAALRAPAEVRLRLAAHPDRAVRRFAFDVMMSAGEHRIADLVSIATNEATMRLRSRAAEAAAREAVWTKRTKTLQHLAKSPHSEVRVVALTGLTRIGLDAEVAAFLDDKASLIRAVARDAARRTGVDSLAHYRQAVAADHPDPGAVDGLSETGTSADAPALVRLLDHSAPKIRVHALRGLRALNAVPLQNVLALLLDSSASVVWEAATTLTPSALAVPTEFLWELLADTGRMVVRRAAYRLLSRRDPVTRLRAALILAADPEPRLARLGGNDATRQIRDARNYRRIGPTPIPLEATTAQLTELTVFGRVAAARLGGETESLLNTWLAELSGD